MTSEILRFATAGSVDDGKSSLIGRLLYDSKSILEDQLLALEHASQQRGSNEIELALLTDGLRAEREQNITIDVAYRYFTTPKRKFIIADTPGHLQYTRNMVTGASTADLAVILIDARNGVVNQSKRHATISALLGIRDVIVAVNKMDLVDFDEQVFKRIEQEFREFGERLGIVRMSFIPVSALYGDNVVTDSERMAWYSGPALLPLLEDVELSERKTTGFRFPVQCVIRPHQDYRGLAGQVESGSIKVGDTIRVASSGITSKVASIHVAGEEVSEASAGQAAVLAIAGDIDIGRGALLTGTKNLPVHSNRVVAVVCWLHEHALRPGARYVVGHTTRRVQGVVEQVTHRIDVDTYTEVEGQELAMNEIGEIVLHTASPLHFDLYTDNQATGSFILIDPHSNVTVGAGMIRGASALHSDSGSANGKVVRLIGWGDEANTAAEELRGFGRNVLLLESGCDNNLTPFIAAATSQGITVLLATGPDIPEPGNCAATLDKSEISESELDAQTLTERLLDLLDS